MHDVHIQKKPTYVVHQLLPSNGIQAVFRDQATDGSSHLAARPLDFVGLATETHSDIESLQVLVGIVLMNGSMEIVNAIDGYCGLVTPGQTVDECVFDCDSDT